MFHRWLSVIGIGLLAECTSTMRMEAEDFQGAEVLVQKLNEGAGAPSNAAPISDNAIKLSSDLLAFEKQSGTLDPADAARQWLALFDRGIALQKNDAGRIGRLGGLIQEVAQQLPPPASWPELQKLAEARASVNGTDTNANILLLLIVHTLNNDEARQWADLAAMMPSTPVQTVGTSPALDESSTVFALGSKVSAVAARADAAAQFWDRAFRAMAEAPATAGLGSGEHAVFELPDLVTLLGPSRAEPLLVQALTLPGIYLSGIAGTETQQAARKLALANIDKLQRPPWFLTESLDASSLYDALIKKYPNDPNAGNAAIYHLLSLVIDGKPDEAVKDLSSVNTQNIGTILEEAAQKGYADQVYQFLHAVLKADPTNPNWEIYINVAAQTGRAPEALQFVKDTLAQKDLSLAAQYRVRPVLYKALLAVDQVDDGIAQLQAQIKAAREISGSPATAIISSIFSDSGEGDSNKMDQQRMEWDIELARLGHLLKREALETEGLDDARLGSSKDNLITYLIESGHNVEAEKYLIDAIVDAAAKDKANSQQPYGYLAGYSERQQNLVKLAQVYYNAGRWTDILTLLEKVPGWGVADLVDVAGRKAYSARYTPVSVGLMAARALAETGQVDQARPILDYVLQVDGGSDAAYELLLRIGQGDLVAKLDALYRQDQFQNRPLIWKATVLLKQGRLDEAEKACRAAIVIDPSDGETGKGDRMRVYSVMADIFEARKDAKQAAFFRNVVKAIRLSEDADDYYDAGLLTRAVTMYDQALGLFSDAYCIQSRIARQLAELGRMPEAAVHYRKAFELMPLSFGRMESHCFGCERAFQGKTAVEIAEKTFTDMLVKDPKNPKLYYLIGYLYMEQQRYGEAVSNFQKAALLDPDYINAWKQIVVIGGSYQMNPALRDEAVFNVLRLDPAGRHISPRTENVRDLARLWKVEKDSAAAIPSAPATLFALPASAAEGASREEQMKKFLPPGLDALTKTFIEQMNHGLGHKPSTESLMHQALLQNGVISTALQSIR